MKEDLPYKFLQNIPIGEDLFEGQSQEKIACVISENIENNDFQIIGIDGGWGTGKSNLVKITEGKLPKNSYKFFIYDVWGHQGDDQRKAILVELTDFITKEKQVKDIKKWKDKLDRLLAKKREITTFNFPYLSIGFIFSLLSIIYIPTVNVFKDSLTDFFGIKQLFWKLLLVMFPVFIVLGIYIWNLLKGWVNRKGFCTSFKLSAQETFQVYTNKQKEETKIETISENEPTVRDFRGWMNEVDSDLKANDKKLVIVFDNFDRLPKKHIQSIWSSIHIFFSEDKYQNIKVIIPFDRAHIKNAFSELNPIEKIDDTLDFANDYINKTFDIVFRISPPIMCDWKVFFKKCWDEAFKNKGDNDEYIRVEQIYETHAKTITPREIIAFINEIISIKLIHKDIPERYVGLFVINKDVILNSPLKAITEAQFLKGLEYLYKDTEDFQKYITALAYQISPDNALEVIYRKQLKDSLVNNNLETFNEISKTNVFDKIVSSVISELDNLDKPILTLNELNNEANISENQKQLLWNDIYLRVKLEKNETVDIKEWQKVLFIHVSKKYKTLWIKNILGNLLNNTSQFNATKYAQVVDELKQINTDSSFDINIDNLLQKKSIQVEDFIALVSEKKEQYKTYKLTVTEKEIDQYLSELDIEKLDGIDYIEYLTTTFTFKQFEESLKDKIDSNKSNADSLEILYDALKIISKSTPKIGLLLEDSEIYSLYTELDKDHEFYYDLIAMRLARGGSFSSSYRTYFNDILETEDEDIISVVSERIEYYINWGDFLLASISFSNDLSKSVIQQLIKKPSSQNRADISTLITKFDKICNINELSAQEFIDNLSRWKSPTFSKTEIESIPIYYFEQAVENESRLAIDSKKSLISYFDVLSKEDWLEIFKNLTGDTFKRTVIIDYSNWNSHSLEALKEVLLTIAQTGNIENEETLTDLIRSFENTGKDLTNTFKNIRDEFIINRNINTKLFTFFGSWLFKYASLEERPGDVIRTIIIAALLDDNICLEQVIENKETLKHLIENASPNEASDFKDAVRDRIDKEEIKILAKEFGIRKRKAKEEKEGSESDNETESE
ncbi:KAP family NTPase [Porphyromonadaceae bacterium OttesenSCG-928-L07]|nr:KAP family NTPase [Porphyromonadaceae bacterium OttesenSCG-928-L07]